MIMLHIAIAFIAVVLSLSALIMRRKDLQRVSYHYGGMTFLSGITLVIINPLSLTHACISGGCFLVIVIGLGRVTSQRLANINPVNYDRA